MKKLVIEIVSSPHRRERGYPSPAAPPADVAAWAALRTLDRPALRELGLRPWNNINEPDPDDAPFEGKTLMLLPGEWYRDIPEGYEVVDIFGAREAFAPSVSDDDIRLGCLSYGILV